MFRRSIYLLAISGAAISFSGTSAMATDTPPPPAGAIPPPAAGVLGSCVDHLPPSARLSSTSARASRSRALRGSSTDRGCGTGGTGKVAKVNVSVARKSGSRCRFLARSHRLGRATSCSKAHWLSAAGTSSWSFRLPKHLTKGRYQVAVRAVDSSGNVAAASRRTLKLK
jgi:hypothetical protein